MDFPGRDWLFIGVVAMIVVPLQMALIPIFSLYDSLHLFDTIPGLILFHTAFGLPLAIFLLRNFFVGIPGGTAGGGAHRRRLRDEDLHPPDPAAGPGRPIASLAIFQFLWTWNDLIVALSLGAQHPADHRGDLHAAASVRRQYRDHRAGGVPLRWRIPLIVFFAFQRYFVQGLLAGSVK